MPRPDAERAMERDLRRLLEREPPPHGFCARVMRQMRRHPGGEVPSRFSLRQLGTLLPARRGWGLAALACGCLLAGILGGLAIGLREGGNEMAGARAEEQLEEVLHLTASQWLRAQQAAFSPLEENGND